MRKTLLLGSVATLLLAVAPAHAEPTPDTPGTRALTWFVDGGRPIAAERVGDARPDLAGHLLTPLLLHYPMRGDRPAQAFSASVDATAIVRVAPGARDKVEELVASRGGRMGDELSPSLGLFLVEDVTGKDGLDLASRLTNSAARDAGVVEAVPNLYLRVKATADPYTPTDPRFGGQWYFQNIGMPDAWGITRGDASTTVVVIDTGCDLSHPDLVSKLDEGLDVVDNDNDPSFSPTDSGAAHGTECAGIIGAATDNDEGIAGGCPECRLRCVRFLSDQSVPLSATVAAFQFAIDVDAAVVSNSWGYVDPIAVPAMVSDVIHELYTNGRGGRGALVLFAAGNDDRDINDDELQAADGVLCIGAINNFDESTPFTNRGNALDLVAPTGTVTTDISGPGGEDPTDYTSLFGGTSSACPVAAGVAGLLVSAAPEKTSAELYSTLIETTRPAPFAEPDANGHDAVYGYGIIQPAKALQVALGLPGEGGGGAGAGGGPATGGSGGSGGSTDGGDDDGCSCTVGSTPSFERGLTVLLLGALYGVRRRRR
ncbi:MAG: S8 family serine peptidase [Polyangiaceae bacterium]